MVGIETDKMYIYYVTRYIKWCDKNNFKQESSLLYYKKHLSEKSPGYVKNTIHAISRCLNIPYKKETLQARRQTLSFDEMNRLKEICKRNYQKEEISLLLLLLLESGLSLKAILNLTKADVENVIVNRINVPDKAMYIFNYLMSISYQKDSNEKYFLKTYHAYLYIFKRRQQQLFPKMPYVTFLNVIRGKNVK